MRHHDRDVVHAAGGARSGHERVGRCLRVPRVLARDRHRLLVHERAPDAVGREHEGAAPERERRLLDLGRRDNPACHLALLHVDVADRPEGLEHAADPPVLDVPAAREHARALLRERAAVAHVQRQRRRRARDLVHEQQHAHHARAAEVLHLRRPGLHLLVQRVDRVRELAHVKAAVVAARDRREQLRLDIVGHPLAAVAVQHREQMEVLVLLHDHAVLVRVPHEPFLRREPELQAD
ncbi:hypothetical protein PybrP1_010800 [[Pythium] brassicae (nom. inval.)]|nr:hypothetical protein PybrP1_010800 [[Pythium] brassicae (nom. inval.)]